MRYAIPALLILIVAALAAQFQRTDIKGYTQSVQKFTDGNVSCYVLAAEYLPLRHRLSCVYVPPAKPERQ